MKTCTALLAVGFACAAGTLFGFQTEEKPIWHQDWPTAQRMAKQANKPIFAVLVCRH